MCLFLDILMDDIIFLNLIFIFASHRFYNLLLSMIIVKKIDEKTKNIYDNNYTI